jgi:hypothetical protein
MLGTKQRFSFRGRNLLLLETPVAIREMIFCESVYNQTHLTPRQPPLGGLIPAKLLHMNRRIGNAYRHIYVLIIGKKIPAINYFDKCSDRD